MQAAATRRTILRELLNPAAICFAAYVGILIYPDVTASPQSGYFEFALRNSLGDETHLLLAVPILILGMTLFVSMSFQNSVRRNQAEFIFTIVFSAIAIFLFVITDSSNPFSGAQWLQYFITLYFYYLCICFWGADEQSVRFALITAAIAISAALCAGLVIHGLPENRFVGLLHPNYFARCAFTAMVLYSIARKKVSLYVFALCVFACYIVSARTILFSSIVFYASYLACTSLPFRVTNRNKIFLLGACFAIPICMLALISMDLNPVFDRVWTDLGFVDLARGVGSGFSGRADSWQYFFDNVQTMVLFGYGFRSLRYGLQYVHSGVLSYFMDFGLLLGVVLILGVAVKGVSILRAGFVNHDAAAIISGLAVLTTLLIQFFEPDNFNVGYIGSAFFMLVLGYNSRQVTEDSVTTKKQFTLYRRYRFFAKKGVRS